MRFRRLGYFVLTTAAAVAAATTAPAEDAMPRQSAEEAQFLAENAAAMTKMMADMHGTSTGNIDGDFVAMMVPHHQGAIDMAVIYLRYGTNEQLRRLAQEIVIEQQQEIAVMRHLIGQAASGASPPPAAHAGHHSAPAGGAPMSPKH